MGEKRGEGRARARREGEKEVPLGREGGVEEKFSSAITEDRISCLLCFLDHMPHAF